MQVLYWPRSRTHCVYFNGNLPVHCFSTGCVLSPSQSSAADVIENFSTCKKYLCLYLTYWPLADASALPGRMLKIPLLLLKKSEFNLHAESVLFTEHDDVFHTWWINLQKCWWLVHSSVKWRLSKMSKRHCLLIGMLTNQHPVWWKVKVDQSVFNLLPLGRRWGWLRITVILISLRKVGTRGSGEGGMRWSRVSVSNTLEKMRLKKWRGGRGRCPPFETTTTTKSILGRMYEQQIKLKPDSPQSRFCWTAN